MHYYEELYITFYKRELININVLCSDGRAW